MPTSKQARARQQRQMDKVAIAHAARERKKRRQRIVWSLVAAAVVVVLVLGAAFAQSNSDSSVNVAPPTTEPPAPTTPTTLRATPTSCTGLKDPLPKGAPAMPLEAGPAPTVLEIKDLTVGTGAEVTKTSTVKVDYVGVNCSGKVFDSSFKEGAADLEVNIPEGGVIQGWLDGLPGMKVGGVRLLSIPPDLAYGNDERSELIPANEPLFFLVKANSVS